MNPALLGLVCLTGALLAIFGIVRALTRPGAVQSREDASRLGGCLAVLIVGVLAVAAIAMFSLSPHFRMGAQSGVGLLTIMFEGIIAVPLIYVVGMAIGVDIWQPPEPEGHASQDVEPAVDSGERTEHQQDPPRRFLGCLGAIVLLFAAVFILLAVMVFIRS